MQEDNEKVKFFLVWLFPIATYLIFAIIYKVNIIEILIIIAIIGFSSLLFLMFYSITEETISWGKIWVFLWFVDVIIFGLALALDRLIVPGYYRDFQLMRGGSQNILFSEGAQYYPIVYSLEIFWIFLTIICISPFFILIIYAILKKRD